MARRSGLSSVGVFGASGPGRAVHRDPTRGRAKKTPTLLAACAPGFVLSALRRVPESDFGCIYALRTKPNEIAPLFLMSFEKQT